MKKLVTLFLSLALISGLTFAQGANLVSPVSSFEIEPIKHSSHASKLIFNFSVPEAIPGSCFIIGFYTDGALTQISSYDISSTTTFKDITITYEITPDEIKVFTWSKNNIIPRSLSEDMLTESIISAANANVYSKLLEQLPVSTKYIRQKVIEATDYDLHKILNDIDKCVADAKQYQSTHLLTSEFAKRKYRQELEVMIETFENAPEDQKERFATRVIDAGQLPDKYHRPISNMQKFFDIEFKYQ